MICTLQFTVYYKYTHTHTHTHIYIYIYAFVNVHLYTHTHTHTHTQIYAICTPKLTYIYIQEESTPITVSFCVLMDRKYICTHWHIYTIRTHKHIHTDTHVDIHNKPIHIYTSEKEYKKTIGLISKFLTQKSRSFTASSSFWSIWHRS